jgi:hypothetical protein
MKLTTFYRSLLPLAIVLISLSSTAQAKSPKLPQCPLDQATYKAIGKPTFAIQFSPIIDRKFATEIVALNFQHRDRGMIASYHLGGSMGYGSYYLRDLAKPIEDDTDANLKPVFFDAKWEAVSDPTKGNAPKYLFISGLGVNDWYADRAGNRDQPIREVMWQLSGCRL